MGRGSQLETKISNRPVGYCILGIAVLVLMVFEIMDGNGPMIGLDAVLLAFIAYMIYKSVRATGNDTSTKR